VWLALVIPFFFQVLGYGSNKGTAMGSGTFTRIGFQGAGRWRFSVGACLLVLLTAAGCAGNHEPNLALLYHDWASQKEGRPPLVGIHGLMGSEIVDPGTGEILWGELKDLFQGSADMRLALPIGPDQKTDLIPGTSIKKIGGMEIYSGIVETLTQMGGYTKASEPGSTPTAPFFPFAYDWRLSCAENAGHLATFIASIQERYHDRSLKVDIVAHSMGGLVARYYILYGGRDVLDEKNRGTTYAGAANVRKLVMLGTPNMGSAEALLALIEGKRVGLARIHPELIATMPSMVELMPSPSEHVLVTAGGEPTSLDIYDIETWKRQRWGIFDPASEPGILRRYQAVHPLTSDEEARGFLRALQSHFCLLLQRAEAFHQALEADPIPASVQMLLLGGDCKPTLRRLVVEPEKGRWKVRRNPADVRHSIKGVDLWPLYYGPGDGDVTKSSLLAEVPANALCAPHTDLPYAVSGFICEDHRDLVKNWTFRDNLLNFLLYKPLPAATACRLPAGSAPPPAPGPH